MSSSTIASMQSVPLPNRLQPGKSSAVQEATTDVSQTPEQKFLDYAKKSPAEKLRDALLQSIGVTEDELKSMTPEQRQQVEQKIADKIKETFEKKSASGESASGFFTDITA